MPRCACGAFAWASSQSDNARTRLRKCSRVSSLSTVVESSPSGLEQVHCVPGLLADDAVDGAGVPAQVREVGLRHADSQVRRAP
jgi:hypothetical protein